MSELPRGWAATDLASVAGINMGQSPKGDATNRDGIGLPLIGGAADYNKARLQSSRFTSTPTKICHVNDIVLCIRATIGRTAIADREYCLGRGVAGLTPTAVERDYLRYYLNAQSELLDRAGTGTTFRQIDKDTLTSWPVPLAPLPEQRRIVAKLDSLCARSKAARDELARIPLLIEHYKQAILEKAFTGELTADWRAEPCGKPRKPSSEAPNFYGRRLPILPDGWQYLRLSELVKPGRDAITTGPFGSLLGKNDYTSRGVPIVGVENVKPSGFVPSFSKFISDAKARDLSKYLAFGGDILITRSGTVGDVSIFPEECENAIISTNLMRLRLNNEMIHSIIFCYMLRGSNVLLKQLEQLCSGSTRIFLNQKILNSLFFPVPPLDEQQEVVCRIETAMEWLNVVAAERDKAAHLLDHLDQGLLAKACRGELITQEPDDEPAEMLLERIRAARAAQPQTRRGRRVRSGVAA